MRQGLLNASGTKFQVNGAGHGSGIYLSPLARMSVGYSMGRHGYYSTGIRVSQPQLVQSVIITIVLISV